MGLRRYERVCTQGHPRVGQVCLPDKEFRYLRHSCYSVERAASTGSGHFCLTPHVAMRIGLYLHPDGTALLPRVPSVQSLRIPLGFLLIVRTGRIVTASHIEASTAGYSGVPAYS
jgi:hypothetical protein